MTTGIRITALILGSRASYLVLFLVIGNRYGATPVTDSVLFIQAPLLVIMAAAAGAAESVVMPAVHRAIHAGCGRGLVTLIAKYSTLSLLPLSLLTAFVAAFFVTNLDLILILTLAALPPLAALSALHAGNLNALGKHTAAASGPIVGAIVAIPLCLLLPLSAHNLAFVLLAQEIGRFAWLAMITRALERSSTAPEKPVPAILKRWAFRGLLAQAAGSLILATNLVVDDIFALQLSTGSVSLVEYASRLWTALPLVAAGPLLLAYTAMSKSAAETGLLPAKQVHRYGARFGIAIVALTACIIPMSNLIVNVLYPIQRLDATSKSALAELLSFYLLGAGPLVVGMVYSRAHSAEGRQSAMTLVALVCVPVNVALNAAFVPWIGLNGIGLSTSIAYSINAALLIYIFERTRVTATN